MSAHVPLTRLPLTRELTLSRIAYGMMRLSTADHGPSGVQQRIEACLAQGITSFDLADIYGGYRNEALLGEALRAAPGLRSQMEIITKCGIVAPMGPHAGARVKHYDTSAEYVTAATERSLGAMGIERIDLLLIHRPDPLMDPEATGRALDDLLDAGKLRAVGVSNFAPHDWSLLQSCMHHSLVTNQIELSLGHTAPFTDGTLAFLQERRVPVMAWAPLGGGLFHENKALCGKLDALGEAYGGDRAAIAIAWLLAHPARILPVLGTASLDRIHRISRAAGITLDRQDWFELYTAARGAEVP